MSALAHVNGGDESPPPTLAYDAVRRAVIVNGVPYDARLFTFLESAADLPRRIFRLTRNLDGVVQLETYE